ncbi:MAG: class I SAM-dependent methyltransferase [Caldilineaceae bacterium]
MQGLRILDLGCGDAGFGCEALSQGCASYLGLEGSQKMAALGRQTLAGTAGRVIHTTMEGWAYPLEQFDLVVSRMALHYIADLPALFAQVQRTLTSGGRFVFSVEHPVITSCSAARPDGEGKRQGWLVDDYFNTGPRVVKWLGNEVVKVHRTVEDYFLTLQAAGFMVEALREARPRREYFADQAEYERRQRIPLMLFLVGQRT